MTAPAPIHYGSNAHGECGAREGEMTLDSAAVTCRTCRGWLPIVAPRTVDLVKVMQDIAASGAIEVPDQVEFNGTLYARASKAAPIHDCAQVERDNLELHQALAEAIRRLYGVRRQMARHDTAVYQLTRMDDLGEVLDRTARERSRPAPHHEWAS